MKGEFHLLLLQKHNKFPKIRPVCLIYVALHPEASHNRFILSVINLCRQVAIDSGNT